MLVESTKNAKEYLQRILNCPYFPIENSENYTFHFSLCIFVDEDL